MSDETVLTPITPEEGTSVPPRVTPSAMTGASTAPTVKLKPVIRKPLIRKPVIGGTKPVTLKPAAGTPPPPAAVPEAAAAETAATDTAPAASAAGAQLKSITSPIAAQAILRKTGIVAEGILTPAQAQAAKTKTSRISLESAIGVAPSVKSSAPMKTIRLRRPTDIPPAPSAVSSAETRLKPVAAATPAAPATPAPAVPVEVAPAEAPAEVTSVKDIGGDAEPVTAATVAADSTEPSVTVTQKKTLKLKRPNFKRPTVGGLRKPGATAVAAAAPAASSGMQSAPVADMETVADMPTVADIPDIRPLPTPMPVAEDDSKTVAGSPAWLNAVTLVAGLAALVAAGLCTWSLYTQAVGPEAGPNGLASFYSETDHSR